jgi:predicted ATPase
LIAEVGQDGESRFRQLETVREFGLERLALAGDEDAVRARHAGYFVTLAGDLQPIVATHGRQSVLDQLAAEHANQQAALVWLEREGPAPAFVALVSALAEYWFCQSLLREGQGWLELALASLDAASAVEQARVLVGYATLQVTQGQFVQARG